MNPINYTRHLIRGTEQNRTKPWRTHLLPCVCVSTGEAHGADDWLPVAYVPPADRHEAWPAAELLRQAEVDEEETVLVVGARPTHQQVVGADVAVHEASLVDELDGVEELVQQKQDTLEGDTAATPH